MNISVNKPTTVFWIISVVALLWNMIGANAYFQQAYKTEAFKSQYNAEQLALIDSSPIWVTVVFAIAIFGGVIGCIGLLFRKKWSNIVFKISLVAILVQMGYSFFMTNSFELFGIFEGLIMPLIVILFAAFLVWYSNKCKDKGLLS